MRLLTIISILLWTTTDNAAQTLSITEPVRMLALGDSYTIGQGVGVNERWPAQLMDSLEARGLETLPLRIIATTGWTTSDLLSGIDAVQPDSNYSLVSLLIGVNNQFRNEDLETYRLEFTELLVRAIKYADGVKEHVIVVSIPDYAFTPVGTQFSNVSEEIEEFNAVNDSIAAVFGVPYLYITDISQRGLDEPDLVASDRLHPSGKMYAEWVSRLIDQSELVLSSSALPETGEDDILLFPNPSSGTVYRSGETADIRIYDLLGRHVVTWQSQSASVTLEGPATYIAVGETVRQRLIIR